MFTSSQYPQPYSFAPVQQKPIPITSLTTKNPLVSQLKIVLEDKLHKATNNTTVINRSNDENGAKKQQNVPYPMTKDKIFAPAGKAYFILNSLFQTYKKHNEFKLLQQKVHKIEVYHTDDQQKIQQEPQQGNQVSIISSQQNQANGSRVADKNRVKPETIFLSHEGELSGKQIQKFIQIQGFIRAQAKEQLIRQIVKSISNLTDIKQIMKCYQKLFTTRYCKQNTQTKQMVQQKMIKKILTLDFSMQQVNRKPLLNTNTNTSTINSNNNHHCQGISKTQVNPFEEIGRSLLGFPIITQNILYLIGLLFDKVPGDNLELYDLMYQIMKRNLSFNVSNLQEALTDAKNKKQIEALMKVNTKENNELIKSLLRAYTKVKEKTTTNNDDSQIINVLKIAQTQAHYKLVKLMAEQQQLAQSLLLQATSPQPIVVEPLVPLMQSLPLAPLPQSFVHPPLTNAKEAQIVAEIKLQTIEKPKQAPISPKTQFTLKFITQVIKSGSNLWQEVNEWLKTTTSINSKSFLIQQIGTYLDRCLNDDKKLKNYILPHIKLITKDLQQTSQVYRLWLRQLLKPLANDKTTVKQTHLKYNIIKKFILKGIAHSQNIPIFIEDLFNPSLLHADLLCDVFALEKDKAFSFFKEILETQHFSKQLFTFLIVLKDKNPIRLKEWLTHADQTKGGELFLCSRSVLIEFVKNHLKAQIAFNWIRDLALYPPSKYLVWILISFISVYKSKKQYFQPLRICIARTINIILIRNPVKNLCDEFKKHLPNLAREFADFNDENQVMFADVTAETHAELKRVHKESQGIKF